MRRLVVLLVAVLALPLVVSAREKRFGYCQAQATGVRVKNCTVEVFITGTLSHPTQLYQDNIGTPLGNPFTASSVTGLWFFYSDNGRYDIKFSGGVPTISPAYTLSDFLFIDIGADTSLTVLSISSASANVAQSGFVRLAQSDNIHWRNFANTNDVGWEVVGSQGGNFPNDTMYYRAPPGLGVVEADAFAANVPQNTIAAGGVFRMASGGAVAWRNAAGTGDYTISLATGTGNLASDFWYFRDTNGGGTGQLSIGSIVQDGNNSSVAASGFVRMHSTDSLCWRNGANSTDLCLNKSAGDVFHLASGLTLDSGGLTASAILSSAANPSSTGTIRLANTDTIKSRNAAGNADATLITLDGLNLVDLGDATFGPLIPSNLLLFSGSGSISSLGPIGTGNGNSITLRATDGFGLGSQTGGNVTLQAGNGVNGGANGTVSVTNSYFVLLTQTFANRDLPGSPVNGAMFYCSDCVVASPCAGGGTGALAKRINGAWSCN